MPLSALLMTSHDREFMNRVVTRIIEVTNRTITTYSGNYDFYLREREIRREQLLPILPGKVRPRMPCGLI